MKYLSEITKRSYDTEAECIAAEKAALQAKTDRQKDAEIVKDLEQKYIDAYETYSRGVKEFIDKYGTYKTTYKSNNWRPMFDPFNVFNNLDFMSEIFN